MKNIFFSLLLASLLSHVSHAGCSTSASTFRSYIRGGLSHRLESVEEVTSLDLSLHGHRVGKQVQDENSSASSLIHDIDFTSSQEVQVEQAQVNKKTYSSTFPTALNTDAAVGHSMAIGVTQYTIEGIDKMTGQIFFTNSLRWIFRNLPGGLLPKNFILEYPRIVYDHHNDRFIVIAIHNDMVDFAYSRILVAVSTSGSPRMQEKWDQDWEDTNADWEAFAIETIDTIVPLVDTTNSMTAATTATTTTTNTAATEDGGRYYPLYTTLPGLAVGVDSSAIYITGAMMKTDYQENHEFEESRLWILDSHAIYEIMTAPLSQLDAQRYIVGNSSLFEIMDHSSSSRHTDMLPSPLLQDWTSLVDPALGDDIKLGPYFPATMDSYASNKPHHESSSSSTEEFGMYMVAYHDSYPSTADKLHIFKIDQPSPLSPTSNGIALQGFLVTIMGFQQDSDLGLPNATQPRVDESQDSYTTNQGSDYYHPILTGDRRIQDCIWSNGQLYVTVTLGDDDSDETFVYWAKMNATSASSSGSNFGAPTISTQGLVDGEGIASKTSTFYPSIAVNGAGHVAIGFSAAGENLHLGSYATLVDIVGGIVQDENVPMTAVLAVAAGQASYESLDGSPYAGEYSAMETDPSEPTCFWTFNTYSKGYDPVNLYTSSTTTITWERGALATAWGKVCVTNA